MGTYICSFESNQHRKSWVVTNSWDSQISFLRKFNHVAWDKGFHAHQGDSWCEMLGCAQRSSLQETHVMLWLHIHRYDMDTIKLLMMMDNTPNFSQTHSRIWYGQCSQIWYGYVIDAASVGNSHRSASPRPTTLEEDRKLFVKFSLILCLWFEIQGLRTYNFFDWISNTGCSRTCYGWKTDKMDAIIG